MNQCLGASDNLSKEILTKDNEINHKMVAVKNEPFDDKESYLSNDLNFGDFIEPIVSSGWKVIADDNLDEIVEKFSGKSVKPPMSKEEALDKFFAFFKEDEEALTIENIKKLHPNWSEAMYEMIVKAGKEKFKLIKSGDDKGFKKTEGEFNVSFN